MSNNPVIIVTGASRGMGAWVAKWLGKARGSVVITARSAKALEEVAREVEKAGGKALDIPADVSGENACFEVVDKCLSKFGRLDALVNNAGVLEPISKIANTEGQSFLENILVNLLGPFYMIKASVEALRQTRGRIINVSTGAAVKPIPAWGAYCASKAGLTHLTRVLAAEEPAITAISLRPGVVDTEMQAQIRKKGPQAMPSDLVQYFKNLKSDGQLEPPWVPARAIAWLALHGPTDWSGELLDYDDKKIAQPAVEKFGANW